MSENSHTSDASSMNARRPDAILVRPLHLEVAERLRELISSGALAPGARLNERVLTERFGISRTPLREAIRMLASEGLVRLLPHRGAAVTAITRRDAQHLFEIMGVLESLAGELACKRATSADLQAIAQLHEEMRRHYENGDLSEYFRCNQAIHQGIVQSSRNKELADIYQRMSARVVGARYLANFSRDRWERAMEEHDQILEALLARDSTRLKALLAQHLANKLEAIVARLPDDAEASANAQAGLSTAQEPVS